MRHGPVGRLLVVEQLETRDLMATGLVSLNRFGGDSGNDESFGARSSADGRYVVFLSNASNLVTTPKGNDGTDVYVRDRQTGVTKLVSVNRTNNGSGNYESIDAAISGNGRYVVFESAASNLVAGSTTYLTSNLYVRDLVAGTTKLVSVNRDGQRSTASNYISEVNLRALTHPPKGRYISDDGRFVVFMSTDDNLVARDSNGKVDVFVRDTVANTTKLVSANTDSNDPDAVTISGNGSSHESVISADGRYVSFTSDASNLVIGITDQHGLPDVFRRDVTAGITKYVSVTPTGAVPVDGSYESQISADGQVIAFRSFADLDTADNNIAVDAYVRDMRKPRPVLVSKSFNGQAANASSYHVVISDDGQHVAFSSDADNLTTNDQDGLDNSVDVRDRDIFVRNILTNVTTLVSVNVAGTGSGNLASDWPSISANGRYVAFESEALNLISGFDHFNNPDDRDVFVRDTGAKKTTLLSATNGSAVRTGRGDSSDAQINQDGRFVTFFSTSNDLVAKDTNSTNAAANGVIGDVFISPGPFTAAPSGAVIVEPGGNTAVVEGGATDTYTIVLKRRPTANVTIQVSPNNQVLISPASIVFTPQNWYVPRTITVRAVNDTVVEGTHNGLIRHTATSTDPAFNHVAIANVVPRITDNDPPHAAVADAALLWWDDQSPASTGRPRK